MDPYQKIFMQGAVQALLFFFFLFIICVYKQNEAMDRHLRVSLDLNICSLVVSGEGNHG